MYININNSYLIIYYINVNNYHQKLTSNIFKLIKFEIVYVLNFRMTKYLLSGVVQPSIKGHATTYSRYDI